MKTILGLLIFFAGSSAYANYQACVTQSRGLYFFREGYDINQTSTDTVVSCQGNPYTNNTECRQNLRCSPYETNPYPSHQVVCTTQSRRLVYYVASYDVDHGSRDAVGQCTSNPYTNNTECVRNLQCYDSSYGHGMVGRPVYCSTTSKNLYFEAYGYDINSTSTQTASQCTANPYTNNSECVNNLRCDYY